MVAVAVGRRRRRSIRAAVALALVAFATVVVVALPTQSPLWLSVAAVLTLVCEVAASWVVYS